MFQGRIQMNSIVRIPAALLVLMTGLFLGACSGSGDSGPDTGRCIY